MKNGGGGAEESPATQVKVQRKAAMKTAMTYGLRKEPTNAYVYSSRRKLCAGAVGVGDERWEGQDSGGF